MAHWFDDITKGLALGKLSRRDAIGLTLRVGLGAAGSQLLTSGGAAEAAASTPATPLIIPPAGPCKRLLIGKAVVEDLSVEEAGAALRLVRSYDSASRISTLSLVITRGQTRLVKADVSVTERRIGTASVEYGMDFKGARFVNAKTHDGTVFQGSADGRTFTASREPNSAKFADGAQAPHVTVDPAIEAVVRKLLRKMDGAIRSCRNVSHPHKLPPGAMPPHARVSGAQYAQIGITDLQFADDNTVPGTPRYSNPAYIGKDWYWPFQTHTAKACQDCENNCWQQAMALFGIDDWAIYLCPPCMAVALAYAAQYPCTAICAGPDGGCCPRQCGSPIECCLGGDNCFRADLHLCCPAAQKICNDVCCPPYVKTCASDGYCGCVDGGVVCGNFCCDYGSACCAGNCCEKGGMCCGNRCCPPGTTSCCGDQCCGPEKNFSCCGGQCCPPGGQCINNTCCSYPSSVCGATCCGAFEVCLTVPRTGQVVGCCPASQTCGNGSNNPVCCPQGQTCTDPNTSTCGGCTTPGYVPTVCQMSSGPTTTGCCPPGVSCCDGKCCKPTDLCCHNPKNGKFGCQPYAVCAPH